MRRGLDHVGLTVASLDVSLAFWHEALGLPLIERTAIADDPVTAALVGLPGVALELADLDAGDGRVVELIEYTSEETAPARLPSSTPGTAHVAVEVDDLDRVLPRLLAACGRLVSTEPVLLDAPGTRWHGLRCCYLADPDGIVVELVERPHP